MRHYSAFFKGSTGSNLLCNLASLSALATSPKVMKGHKLCRHVIQLYPNPNVFWTWNHTLQQLMAWYFLTSEKFCHDQEHNYSCPATLLSSSLHPYSWLMIRKHVSHVLKFDIIFQLNIPTKPTVTLLPKHEFGISKHSIWPCISYDGVWTCTTAFKSYDHCSLTRAEKGVRGFTAENLLGKYEGLVRYD